MVKFPMTFEVQASSASGIQTQWTAQTDLLPPIPSAIPPEFMGPGGGYSPEDLFGIALLNCLIAMFKVYAEKSQVGFDEIQGKAILTANKVPDGPSFVLSHVDVHFEITGASDIEKARKVLDSAIKDCPVSNSIKSGKSFHINIA